MRAPLLALLALLPACDRYVVGPAPACDCPTAMAPAAPPDGRGERLRPRFYRGEDGSRAQLLGMHDEHLDADCIYALAADLVLRCVPVIEPEGGDVGSYYADAECKTALVLTPLCPAVVPRFGAQMHLDSCGVFWRVYGVGARWDGPVFQQPPGNACVESVLPKGYGVWVVGEELPPETFVAGAVE